MSESVLQIEHYELEREVFDGGVTLIQRRSDVHLQEMSRLSLLSFSHPYLAKETISWDEDRISYSFELPDTSLSWEYLESQAISERLRVLLNVLELRQLLSLNLTFYLTPSNLHIDHNGHPRLLYRGVKDLQPPFAMSESVFLRQVKSLIVSHFTAHDFNTLYMGGLEAIQESPFIETVKSIPDLSSLESFLKAEYLEAKSMESDTFQQVPRTQFRLFKQLSLVFGVLMVLFLVPLIYLGLIRGPFQDKLLAADRAFLKVDYSQVVTILEDVGVDRLPLTQKYELAHSYVQLVDLPYDSKQIILNNITLISDETYLDYWIHDGRGEFDQSLDLGKRLEDYQLIIYALDQKIVQVRQDKSLDGASREELLTTLEGEFDKYSKMRSDLLASEDSAIDSPDTASSSSAGQASAPTESQTAENKE